jgi:hypothetical protein
VEKRADRLKTLHEISIDVQKINKNKYALPGTQMKRGVAK